MNFSVNFMDRTSAVIKEALLLKKYKAMPLVLAIIVGIFMLPLILVSAVLAVSLYIFGYLFSIVSLPIDRLYKILHNEGQSVQHATQFIIYFLSWAFIFSAYAMLSFLMIVLTVTYSLFSIVSYIWTLGGFKFHLFASEEDISVEVEGKYNILIPAIYVGVAAVLLLILPLIQTISTTVHYPSVSGDLFFKIYEARIVAGRGLRILFAAIYSLVAFAPNPKKEIKE